VKVSGEGFPANAPVVIHFHTQQIGDTTTNGDGKFSNVAVTIPTSFSQFAPQQFFIQAVSGAMSAVHAHRLIAPMATAGDDTAERHGYSTRRASGRSSVEISSQALSRRPEQARSSLGV
jgi:hypothetical protein